MHIDEDFYISFCKTHIKVYKPAADDSLKVKFVQGSFKDKSFTYLPKDYKLVRIGRKEGLELPYTEESISRIQCTFSFEDGSWYVYDGNMEKPSTNGSWIMNTKIYEIQNGDIFKTGNVVFSTKVI